MSNIKLLTQDPFFIFYDARSGSTFLANQLVKNKGVAIPPESNFIPFIILRYPKDSIDNKYDLELFLNIIYTDKKFNDWNIKRDDIKGVLLEVLPISVRDSILAICAAYRNKNFPEAKVFGIKKGGYLKYYRKLKKLFPQSKIIGIIRDGRAVFNSKKESIYSETGKPFEIDPYKAAKKWCKCINLLREIKQRHKETLIIRYKEMITDPGKVIKTICKFLDIFYNLNKPLVDKAYFISSRYRNLHRNIEKGALGNRISAWRTSLSDNEIYAFESVAYNHLIREGYEPINAKKLSKNPTKKLKRKIKIDKGE